MNIPPLRSTESPLNEVVTRLTKSLEVTRRKHRHFLAAMIASASALAACARVPITTQLPPYIYQSGAPAPEARHTALAISLGPNVAGRKAIENLYAQVTGQTPPSPVSNDLRLSRTSSEIAQQNPLYPALAQTSLIKKFATQLYAKLNATDVATVQPPKVSAQEFKEFFNVFSSNFGNMFSDPERVQARLSQPNPTPTFDDVLIYYYKAYFDGTYVTRDGVTLTKPGVTASFDNRQLVGSVNNNTITGIVTVFFEALLDYFVRVPLNPSVKLDAKPTGETMPGSLVQVGTTNTSDSIGLSTQNWQTVNYASSASATGAQILTSMILKSFGGGNLGFAVAYFKLSFGDNTTLTTMVDTALGLILKRDAEWTTFHLLKGDLKSNRGTMGSTLFRAEVWKLSRRPANP
jgi:hypothetical protein